MGTGSVHSLVGQDPGQTQGQDQEPGNNGRSGRKPLGAEEYGHVENVTAPGEGEDPVLSGFCQRGPNPEAEKQS